VARLTNKQISPEQNILLQCSRNDFMNFFTEKIESIRNIILNVQSFMVSYDSASIITPQEQLHRFTTIGQEELNKLIIAYKPTCLLDPIRTKLLKAVLPVVEEPLLNIINVSLFLGHVPRIDVQDGSNKTSH